MPRPRLLDRGVINLTMSTFAFANEVGPNTLTPRPFQAEAVEAVRNEFKRGIRRTLIWHATGLGKSVLGSLIARMVRDKGNRVLICVHMKDLVISFANQVERTGVTPGIEMGSAYAREHFNPNVVVASIQSMQGDRLKSWPKDYFDLIMIDEAHHRPSPRYEALFNHFADVHEVGMTATPWRMDGQKLADYYETIAHKMNIRQGVTEGYLARPKYLRTDICVNLKALRPKKGDFTAEDLHQAMLPHIGPIANKYDEVLGDRPAIIFVPLVVTAQFMATALNSVGRNFLWIDGDDPDRDGKQAAYANGNIQGLVCSSLLTEGSDFPKTAAIGLTRPTKSLGLYHQMIGRGLRAGKEDCIAEGQRVLTDQGLVPIELVTTSMKVWDGCEYVPHAGVVCKGERDVITYAGLTATPDHRVWTKDGWRTLGDCQKSESPISVTGNGREAIREAEGRFSRNTERRKGKSQGSRRVRILRIRIISESQQRLVREGWMSIVRQSQKRADVVVSQNAVATAAMPKRKQSILSTVRRTWDRVSIQERNRGIALGSEQLGACEGYGVGPHRQQRPLRAGKHQVRQQEDQHEQHSQKEAYARDARVQAEASKHKVCRRYACSHDRREHDRRADYCSVPQGIMQTKRRVWDILNAGPRHRFTVEGLLVSNCLVIDFAYLTAKNDLCGPEGLLCEEFDKPRVIKLNDREIKTATEMDVLDVVEKAKVRIEKERIDRQAHEMRVAKRKPYTRREELVDPFANLGTLPGMPSMPMARHEPPTPKQVAFLQRNGHEGAAKYSKRQAGRLIGLIMQTINSRPQY